MQCEFFNSTPKTTKSPKERKAHPSPSMLEIFIVLNEKDNEKKTKGRGMPMTPK